MQLPGFSYPFWSRRLGDTPQRHSFKRGLYVTVPLLVQDGEGPPQFRSLAQSCPTLCDPMDCSTPGLPVHHQLLERTQTHVHRVGDAIQPSHPLLSPSPPTFNLSKHQGLFKWVSSLHQVTKGFEFQHQSFPVNIQDWFPFGLTC